MYSIIVNSTDSFEDCWFPFFLLFKKFWHNYNGNIYLNTETKDFYFPGLNILPIKNNIETPDKKITWSQCLIKAIEKIETDIILYLQEDYFINNYVNYNQISEFVNLMSRENISCIHLTPYGPGGPYLPTLYNKLYLVSQKAPYRICTQAALWKKEVLKKYLRHHENAWQFEIYGTKRSYRKKDTFYCINSNIFNNGELIISYYPTGIIHGRWNKEAVFKLFNENKIHIDFEERGFFSSKVKSSRKKITINKIINRIRSYY